MGVSDHADSYHASISSFNGISPSCSRFPDDIIGMLLYSSTR
jgi:hypothetical protein